MAMSKQRVITACMPCYTKKQKCNRQFPCNHCTRRRRTEDCVYASSSQALTTGDIPRTENDVQVIEDTVQTKRVVGSVLFDDQTRSDSCTRSTTLEDLYGNVRFSRTSTLALVNRLGIEKDMSKYGDQPISGEALREIEQQLRRLPDQAVFDFLVQYFAKEIHWMEQILYMPSFLSQYQQWWTYRDSAQRSLFEIEFTILFLRLAGYAAQFLPSSSCPADCVYGMLLDDIYEICDDVAEKLTAICTRLDATGALIRVQHLSVLALQRRDQGRMSDMRDALSDAINVAIRIGMHRGRESWGDEINEFDIEIHCRLFCNLYVWDSDLSKQLDCPPLLSLTLTADHLPPMILASSLSAEPPEYFTERMLQARLANFWRSFTSSQPSIYDPAVAEEYYNKFRHQFLATLPSAFQLEPCRTWDERLPRLPLQRQLLHIAIFESICWNLRPVSLYEPADTDRLARQEQALVLSQKKSLAIAALKVLDGISTLHSMLNGSQTRCTRIILSSFEAAVVLVSLLMDPAFPAKGNAQCDPLGEQQSVEPSRVRSRETVQVALERLERLAESSTVAKTAAKTLGQLLKGVPGDDVVMESSSVTAGVGDQGADTLEKMMRWYHQVG